MEQKDAVESDGDVGSDTSSFEDLSAQELASLNNGAEKDKIEEVKTDEWMDVLGSGNLLKKILKEGDTASELRPQRSEVCTIRLKGSLEDGTVVEEYESLEVQVGDLEVVQGLDLCLPLMYINECALIKLQPKLAYDKMGRMPEIPPDSVMLYEVELKKIVSEEDMEKLPVMTRKKIGNQKRERGNWWNARNECNYAIQCYRRALDYLDDVEGGITQPTEDGELKPTDADLQDLLEDRMKVYNNMAAAQMKLELYDAALKSLENVLMCQPQNVKALFRKSKALIHKNDAEEARLVLKKALAIDPSNVVIQKEMQKIVNVAQKHRDHERNMAKRMLEQDSGSRSKQQSRTKKLNKLLIYAPIAGLLAIGVGLFTAYKLKYD